jgi:iron-sulfur cluster repair protein YtfE (RIC family)
MRASEVRQRVSEQHTQLRHDLARLERLAHSAREKPSELEALRMDAEALLERLHEHMRWEEAHLLPMLRRAGAWGREQAERLIDEHSEQRELLDIVVELLWDAKRSAALVGRDIVRLVALLLEDMAAEEALLDERMLDQETT